MSESEKEPFQDKLDRASNNGCIWLNPIVQKDNNFSRLLGTRGPVVSRSGKIWMVIVFIIVGGGLTLIRTSLGPPPFIFWFIYSFPCIIIWTIIATWQARRLANISPYKLTTGEGSFTWFKVFVIRIMARASWLWGKPKAYNVAYSNAAKFDGKPRLIETEEYIGTFRIPDLVYNFEPREVDYLSHPGTLHEGNDVHLYMPAMSERSSEGTGLTDRERRAIRKHRKKIQKQRGAMFG